MREAQEGVRTYDSPDTIGLPLRRELLPVERLWLAVLEDAVRLAVGQGKNIGWSDDPEEFMRRKMLLQKEALDWINGQSESALPFRDLCAALDIDPEFVHNMISEAINQQAGFKATRSWATLQ